MNNSKPIGRGQADEMAKPLNPDQRAPADQSWRPDSLGGIKVGDLVRLPNIAAAFQVVELADPLLILQSPSGHRLRAGWRAVTKQRTRADIEGQRHE